eukprot:scaffold23_cov268-Pinguiococcus_pyrenoidosus.AAC.15
MASCGVLGPERTPTEWTEASKGDSVDETECGERTDAEVRRFGGSEVYILILRKLAPFSERSGAWETFPLFRLCPPSACSVRASLGRVRASKARYV